MTVRQLLLLRGLAAECPGVAAGTTRQRLLSVKTRGAGAMACAIR
jgi:hypothetical protein